MQEPTRVVAQLIRTTWTKRARGAPLARLRNATPERLALPATLPTEDTMSLIHRVEYGEQNGFAASLGEQLDAYPDIHTPLNPAVELQLAGNMLHVVLRGPYPLDSQHPPLIEARMGAPRRLAPRSSFALQSGEWGQLRYMGRWNAGWDQATYYEKWVCNIGWLSVIAPGVFLDTEPAHRYESMPDVW